MKISCNVIKDLLPLYVEGMLSPDSAALVDGHVKECPACAGELEAQQKECSMKLEKEETPHKCEAASLKKVKKRLGLRIALISIGSVLAVFLLLFAVFKLWPVSVDYGESELFTREEMSAAVDAIKLDCMSMIGVKLFSLKYAGDERSRRELDYANTYLNDGVPYTDCIVFNSVFAPPLRLGGAWDGHLYDWSFILVRYGAGPWIVLEKGYC